MVRKPQPSRGTAAAGNKNAAGEAATPGETGGAQAKPAAHHAAAEGSDPDPNLPTGSPPPPPGPIARALSSGVFFMLVGAGFLWAAYSTMTETHTSFTFVLVVVGVAILLYGTGTQSAGQFSSEADNAKYKVAVAGGAGVLAFLVGYGIVEKAPEIQNAFQVEKKYFRYMVEPMEDGVTDLRNYVAVVEINGERVPAVTRGRRIEVYVPYFAGKRASQMTGLVELYRVVVADRQRETKSEPFTIVVQGDAFLTDDGGYDIPPFNGPPLRVSMRAEESVDSTTLDASQSGTGLKPPPVSIGAE